MATTAESRSLSPTRVGLVTASGTAGTHLADITAHPLGPGCLSNLILATTTRQKKPPTLRGIDWVSNAVRGGLGRVLLSPWVLGEA